MDETLERQELLYWNGMNAWCFCTTLAPNFSNMLKIPKKFGKHFKSKLHENMILIGRDGQDWPVKLTRRQSSDEIALIGSGWQRFVEEQCLQVGDFLVFRYGGDFRFDVLTFDHKSGCEKVQPFFTNRRSNTGFFFRSQGGCSKLPSSDEDQTMEQTSLKSSDAWDDDDELSSKILHERSSTPISRTVRGRWKVGGRGRGRGRGYGRGGGRGRPGSIALPSHGIERISTVVSGGVGKRGRGRHPLPCRGRGGRRGAARWGPRGAYTAMEGDGQDQQNSRTSIARQIVQNLKKIGAGSKVNSLPEYSTSDTDHSIDSEQYYQDREEEQIAELHKSQYSLTFISRRRPVREKDLEETRALALAFESPNPSFIVEMRRTHVTVRFVLTIPAEFVRRHLVSRTGSSVTLQVPGNTHATWTVDCDSMKGKMAGAQLTKGWPDFVFDNVIEQDDALVFELQTNEENVDQLAFDVHIFRVVPEITPLKKHEKTGTGKRHQRSLPQGPVIELMEDCKD